MPFLTERGVEYIQYVIRFMINNGSKVVVSSLRSFDGVSCELIYIVLLFKEVNH